MNLTTIFYQVLKESEERLYAKDYASARETLNSIEALLDEEDEATYDFQAAIDDFDDEPFEYLATKYGEIASPNSIEEDIANAAQEIRDYLRSAKSKKETPSYGREAGKAYELFDSIASALDEEDWNRYDFLSDLDQLNDEPFEYLAVKYGKDSHENGFINSDAESITDTAQEIRDILRSARREKAKHF